MFKIQANLEYAVTPLHGVIITASIIHMSWLVSHVAGLEELMGFIKKNIDLHHICFYYSNSCALSGIAPYYHITFPFYFTLIMYNLGSNMKL